MKKITERDKLLKKLQGFCLYVGKGIYKEARNEV